jgi:hypothetical protein
MLTAAAALHVVAVPVVVRPVTVSWKHPPSRPERGPGRSARGRAHGARTRLRALYLDPAFPIYKVHEPGNHALFSPKKLGKARTQAS